MCPATEPFPPLSALCASLADEWRAQVTRVARVGGVVCDGVQMVPHPEFQLKVSEVSDVGENYNYNILNLNIFS